MTKPPPPQQQQRKLRRSRDATGNVVGGVAAGSGTSAGAAAATMSGISSSSSSSSPSGFELYERQGNTAAAYQALYGGSGSGGGTTKDGNPSSSLSMAQKYNRILLQNLLNVPLEEQMLTHNNNNNNNSGGSKKKKKGGGNNNPSSGGDNAMQKKKLAQLGASDRLLKQLENFPQAKILDALTARKRQRNKLIMAYNRALIWYTQQKWADTEALCYECLQPMMAESPQQQQALPLEIAKVASRMAFLWLETRLASKARQGSHHQSLEEEQKQDPEEEETKEESSSSYSNLVANEEIVSWLEGLGLENKSAEFKFLLSLYKGRVDLAARLPSVNLHEESRIRSARKELKTAMEVFQHRLRETVPAAAPAPPQQQQQQTSEKDKDNLSTVSSVDSKEKAQQDAVAIPSAEALSSSNISASFSVQQPQQSIVLQKLQQSALNLKANLEQLKGNVKKSLILCQEAQFDADLSGSGAYYSQIHSNNLAVVYQTTHKKHLAWHVLSKALAAQPSLPQMAEDAKNKLFFSSDGAAEPVLSLYTLQNAALCALQARHYRASYECWAMLLVQTHHKDSRNTPIQPSLTWLRLAEACMGMHYEMQTQQQQTSSSSLRSDFYQTTPIQVHGEPKGLFISQPPSKFVDDKEPLPALGSPEDLELVSLQPLKRARSALEYILDNDDGSGAAMDDDTRQTARLSLAYVSLLARDYERALELSQVVLEDEGKKEKTTSTAAESSSSTTTTGSSSSSSASVGERVRSCRCATARMYAAEALCCLGNPSEAMRHLVEHGNNDNSPSTSPDNKSLNTSNALDRLASDLGGVTIETAAVSAMGKRRLARAQTLVRSSASIVTAAVGLNMTAAKQLAMSAQAMEDASFNSHHGASMVVQPSAARRALIYCLLRGGNTSAALSLLQSMRNHQ